jgi:hypothetical protein
MNDRRPLDIEQYADVGQRISKAPATYLQHPLPFILIAAAYVPFAIASSIDPILSLVLFIPGLLAQEIVNGALIVAAERALHGQQPSVQDGFTAATDRLGALLEYFGRTFIVVFALAITVIGIPWAIRVAVRWIFGTQAVMLHDMSAKESISESCRVVTGNWWRTLGNLLLVGLIASLPSLVIAFAVGGIAGGVIGAVWGTLTTPFFSIFVTLFYFRLRHEKTPARMTEAEPT